MGRDHRALFYLSLLEVRWDEVDEDSRSSASFR